MRDPDADELTKNAAVDCEAYDCCFVLMDIPASGWTLEDFAGVNSFIRDEYIAKKVSGLGTSVWVDRNRVRVKKWKTDPLLRMYEINQQICDWSVHDIDPDALWDTDAVKTLFIHVE